jgi:hypothetical protein
MSKATARAAGGTTSNGIAIVFGNLKIVHFGLKFHKRVRFAKSEADHPRDDIYDGEFPDIISWSQVGKKNTQGKHPMKEGFKYALIDLFCRSHASIVGIKETKKEAF